MTDLTTRLVDRLAVLDKTGLDLAFLVPLLRLLASGNLIDGTTLAAAGHTSTPPFRRDPARLW